MSEDQNNTPTELNREQELELQLKRALADYANLNKRLDKEKIETAKFSNELLMMQLVNVLDGLEMTASEFRKLLAKNGFERVEVNEGDKFDPNLMQAIDAENNGANVSEVYAPAYRLHEKIIRPAQVKLGKDINMESSRQKLEN